MTEVSKGLQSALGYRFVDQMVLARALTHRSAGPTHNERLEFLGDSVLSIVISDNLYRRYPEATEGELTRCRARLVRQETLAVVAQELGLAEALAVGLAMGERGSADRPGVLADALEALIGAVFIDGGYPAVVLTVEGIFAELLIDIAPESISKDAKTALQELLHKLGLSLPIYRVVLMRGEPHLRQFDVECYLPATNARFLGQGASRRKAEQEAAQRALDACTSSARHG